MAASIGLRRSVPPPPRTLRSNAKGSAAHGVGDRPWSAWKIVLAALLPLLVLFVLMQFQQ
jgi:hypothetical protein